MAVSRDFRLRKATIMAVLRNKEKQVLTGKRSAGPFWISRPVRSQLSSVPAMVTVPRAGLNAPPRPPPRPPPLPPLAGGILDRLFSRVRLILRLLSSSSGR